MMASGGPGQSGRGAPARSPVQPGVRAVAKLAGVSTATVSRVLSGRGPASDATRTLVVAAAGRLGYEPNAAARSLRTARTMLIGVLVPDLANRAILPFLRGVEQAAQPHGYAVVVADAQRSDEIEARQLALLHAQRVDGLILSAPPRQPATLAPWRAAGVAMAGPEADGRTRWTGLNESAAIDDLCAVLAAHGHRRVAFLAHATRPGGAVERRLDEARGAAGKRDVEVEALLLDPTQEAERLAALLDSVVRGRDPATAVIVAVHALAAPVLRAMWDARIEIPRECSFCLFGDSDWAAAYRPPISVVRSDLGEAGARLTRAVLASLDGREPEPAAAAPPAQLVRRLSIADARPTA
jgi:LacI family transcriptional regulator, galactose operon repressor